MLNGGKYVRTEVREKIEQEIEGLGYSPNHLARSLVLQKTHLLGVIVTDITAGFFATILSSVEAYASQCNCKIQDGYRLMQELLECDLHPTAVFAVSDDMAAGALNCIIDHGLKVPDDFSIIGFDDSSLATSVRPRLTTVHQPISEIGKLSVDILLKQINGEAVSLKEIILNHHLVERESCRRL